MIFVRNILLSALIVFTTVGIGFGQFDLGQIRTNNIAYGLLAAAGISEVQPLELNHPPAKNVDLVDWDALNVIENNSIASCNDIDMASASWKFWEAHKQPETDILLVSLDDELYPCRYMARHLIEHGFGMAALEDVPLAIAQKFATKYPIFIRADKFYEWIFHHPDRALDFIRHEEAHLLQARYNPLLERYMWDQEKTKLTPFGRFVEGCTEWHFRTGGPGYDAYIVEYKALLTKAVDRNQKDLADRACQGNFDAFVSLQSL